MLEPTPSPQAQRGIRGASRRRLRIRGGNLRGRLSSSARGATSIRPGPPGHLELPKLVPTVSMTSTSRQALLPALLLTVGAASCADEFASSDDEPLDVSQTARWPDTLMVDDDTIVALTVRLDDGSVLTGTEVAWSSSDTSRLLLRPVPAQGSGVTDSLSSLLRVELMARARGAVTVSASISRPGLQPTALTDTVRILERWRAVSAGSFHTCGLTVRGDAYCWGALLDSGSDLPGMGLGDGHAIGRILPGALLDASPFQQLSAGWGFTCGAASPTGLPFCWGSNQAGELGDGTQVSQLTATRVLAGRTVTAISAGIGAACATFPPPARVGPQFLGNVACWGKLDSPSSDRVLSQVAVGDSFACILEIQGTNVRCFGRNAFGQLGDGTTVTTPPFGPTTTVVSSETFISLSAGGASMCGVTSAHEAYCWGHNRFGQLGTGATDTTPVLTPSKVQGLVQVDSVVTSGTFQDGLGPPAAHSCALLSNREIWCWGSNTSGQLGNAGAGEKSPVPVRVHDPPGEPVLWSSISVGSGFPPTEADGGDGVGHSCALTMDGVVYCWGHNQFGQLGSGDTIRHSTPVRIAEPEDSATGAAVRALVPTPAQQRRRPL
jgi:alpha-tubulin suppressor-like RCC1 family protein